MNKKAQQRLQISIPYTARKRVGGEQTQEEIDNNYLKSRMLSRFLHILGSGIQRTSKEHAAQVAAVNIKIGKQLSETMEQGFEGVQRGQIKIHSALIDQTEVMQTGFDNIEFALYKGFDKVSGGLADVTHSVDQVGETMLKVGSRLEGNLAELKASVDMGMLNIVSQFELQREEMQAGFDRLIGLLENQHKTKARERFLDGKLEYERYLQHPDEPQFIEDAHVYFLQSLEFYKGNPFVHLYLGHIYQEASKLFDLEKSAAHYRLCATYAKGMDNSALAALAYFMAAWISYVRCDFGAAIELGELAIQSDPQGIPEAYYNLARTYAHTGDSFQALSNLDTAIQQFDPNYSLKADIDPDFAEIRKDLNLYFEKIREQEAVSLQKKLKNLGF